MSTTATKTSLPTTVEVEYIPTGDVQAELNFYFPPSDGAVPYYYVDGSPSDNIPQKNYNIATHTATIHDARAHASLLSLDKEAFEIHTEPSTLTHPDFDSESIITSTYYPEIETIIRKHLGTSVQKVLIFDHTVRRNKPGATRGPVGQVHIDQTPKAGLVRVGRHFNEELARDVAEKGLRARIVNVWRPINGDVVDHPLAFADSSTVEEKDLVGVRHIYKDKEGETAGVKFNEGQKWYYLSGHKNEEVVLIKCWDSDTKQGGGEEGKRGRVPHTAFDHPKTQENSRLRESIEVRCLVIG